MAFCNQCGTQVAEGVQFCPNCGAPVQAGQSQPQQAPQQPEFIQNFTNTADTTGEFDPADIQQNKIMAVLAYLSWLVLIPIFAAPQSRFARYHANQGLVLAITEIVWWIATGILTTVLYNISWTLGSLVSTVLGLANLVFLVLLVIGIMNAANGQAKELPLVGKFRILK